VLARAKRPATVRAWAYEGITSMYENLLPIGSVVLLEGGTKRVVVMGRIVTPGETTKIYDYVGCLYPEGMTDLDSFYFFDHDSIERVYFIGFQDPEELQFRAEKLAPLGELYVNDEGQIVERPAE